MRGGKLEPPTWGASPSALAPFPFRREPGEALGAGTHDPGARRLPGWQKWPTIARSTLLGSGVDRAAGQDMTKENQGTVPPRGDCQATLAWLTLVRLWFHLTRPDQTLCSRRQRDDERGCPNPGRAPFARLGFASCCDPLAGAECVATPLPVETGFLIEKFHPGDGAMTESIQFKAGCKSLIGFRKADRCRCRRRCQ